MSKGSSRLKIFLMVYLVLKSGDSGKLMLPINFSFSIEGIRFFRYKFCKGDSCSVLFLIHDEYGIGLNVDFPNKCTSLCSKLFICVLSGSVFAF